MLSPVCILSSPSRSLTWVMEGAGELFVIMDIIEICNKKKQPCKGVVSAIQDTAAVKCTCVWVKYVCVCVCV